MERPLKVGIERHNGTTVVSPVGEIDMLTAPKLRASLLAATNSHVVVDLRAVSFLDSSGIGVLAEAHHRITVNSGELTLRKPQGVVRRALEIVGLAGWIED